MRNTRFVENVGSFWELGRRDQEGGILGVVTYISVYKIVGEQVAVVDIMAFRVEIPTQRHNFIIDFPFSKVPEDVHEISRRRVARCVPLRLGH